MKPRLSIESAQIALQRNELEFGGDICICECGCGEMARQFHHLASQQKFPEWADHPDNVVVVATRCHERHTNAFERYPRRLCHRMEAHADAKMDAYFSRIYTGGGNG